MKRSQYSGAVRDSLTRAKPRNIEDKLQCFSLCTCRSTPPLDMSEVQIHNGHAVNGMKAQEIADDGEPVTRDTFKMYMRDIGSVKLLTKREEKKLALKNRAGDEEARDRMIKANLLLVIAIAKDYQHLGLPFLDLVNEGNIGLTKAVDRYDPHRGAKFSTYASWWIKQAIKSAIANQSRMIRIPLYMVDRLAKVRKFEQRYLATFGRLPTDAELAIELDVSEKVVVKIRKIIQQPVSLDAATLDPEYGEFRIEEFIADEQAVSALVSTVQEEMSAVLREALKKLDDQERTIIIERYGLLGEAQSLSAVGKKKGLTGERIRQLQKIALKKMQSYLRNFERFGAFSWLAISDASSGDPMPS